MDNTLFSEISLAHIKISLLRILFQLCHKFLVLTRLPYQHNLTLSRQQSFVAHDSKYRLCRLCYQAQVTLSNFNKANMSLRVISCKKSFWLIREQSAATERWQHDAGERQN